MTHEALEQAGIWMASKTALRNGRTAKEASRESLKNYLDGPQALTGTAPR